MRWLPSAPPTVPDVKDYLIRFLGSDPFDRIRNQTDARPFGAQLCCPTDHKCLLTAWYALCGDYSHTVCGLDVPPVAHPSRTLCPASPSLKWVPWTSVPHLTGQKTDHRYYCQLRLPNARLGFVRCSLSAPDTLVAPLLSLTGQDRAFLPSARTLPHWLTGALDRITFAKETFGSPKFTGYPLDCMPCSQTPVVFWSLAIAWPKLLPSVIYTTSAFVRFPELIRWPPWARFRGSITQPAALLHPASDSRCRAYPRIWLLTCWLSFDQVGLSRYAITHWVTSSNFMDLSPIPTICA